MHQYLALISRNLYRSSLLLRQRCPLIASTSGFHVGIGGNCETSILSSNNNRNAQAIRFIRSRNPDEKREKEDDGRKSESSNENHTENSDNSSEQPKKVDPALIKKLRIYVLVVAGLSFVSSFILLSQMFTGDRNIAEGLTSEDMNKPGIAFNTFIQKYLNRGEVKRIVFVPSNHRAIAFLHPGAVVDGKPVSSDTVVVEYLQNAQQFWADIRKAEGELGIGLTQGVQIDLYQGMTTFKAIELLVGVAILAWLGTQYGRLLRKRLLESQAKKSGK